MSASLVIHFVRGLAPGHTPICGADGMGSLLPQLVTCLACKSLMEPSSPAKPPPAAAKGEG